MTDKDYFEKVYKEACEITAYLCDMYNIDPHGTVLHNGVNVPTILCHYDSHKLGLGSNHGDVYHWFKKYGKDMEDVRNDVSELIEKSVVVAPTENSTVKKEDVVKIDENATYYSGKAVPTWVKNKTWIVKEIVGDRAVIDKSADGKNAINSPISTKYLTVVSSKFTPYLARVSTDVLNIRKGAGTNYAIIGTIKDRGTYTIVDESTGVGATKWGLLKSYKDERNGWISLDYCTKI